MFDNLEKRLSFKKKGTCPSHACALTTVPRLEHVIVFFIYFIKNDGRQNFKSKCTSCFALIPYGIKHLLYVCNGVEPL
jgi:hypothetical protein